METISNTKFSLQLYELIRSRTDEETAKKVVETVEGIVEQKTGEKLNGIATKQDIYMLKEDIVRIETKIDANGYLFPLVRLIGRKVFFLQDLLKRFLR